MNNQDAKMAVLKQIMDLFTDQQLHGLKKKGQPDMMAVSVKADGDKDPLAALAGKDDSAEDGKKEPDEDDDPELLKKLLEMHESGESDSK